MSVLTLTAAVLGKVSSNVIRDLIQNLLHPNPRLRPSASQVFHKFAGFYKVLILSIIGACEVQWLNGYLLSLQKCTSSMVFPAALSQHCLPRPPHTRRGSFTQCTNDTDMPPWNRKSSTGAALEPLHEE